MEDPGSLDPPDEHEAGDEARNLDDVDHAADGHVSGATASEAGSDAGDESYSEPDDQTADDFGPSDEFSLGDGLDGLDSFDEFVFDDAFVRAAEVREPTAAERQRAIRQANLRRLLQDQEAQQENRLHEQRRFAPPPDSSGLGADRPGSYEDHFGDDVDSSEFHDELHDPHGPGRPREPGGPRYDELLPSVDNWSDSDWQADLHPDDYDLWLSLRRRRRNRRVLTAVSAIVVVAVLFVYGLSQFFAGLSLRNLNSGNASASQTQPTLKPGSRAPGDPADAAAGSTTRPDGWPPLGKWALTPLGAPAAVPAGGGPHKFLMVQSDGSTPVAYDPCRVIHYVTGGSTNAPDSADRLLSDAIKTVSELTGLVFVDDGATDEAPSDSRAAYQPDRYGKRWAPVLISWSNAAASPRLGVTTPEGAPPGSTVDVLGYAGSVSAGFSTEGATVKAGEPKGLVTRVEGAPAPFSALSETPEPTVSEDRIYVTGSLVLDSENFSEMLAQYDGYARARATVLHELGHLVGLDHVNAADQLMAPTLHSSVTEFAAGDRAGLAALGSGACVPEI